MYKDLPRKLAFCIVGHTTGKVSRHIWFALTDGTAISTRVVSPEVKQSPLMKGELELEIELEWENSDNNLQILEVKVKCVWKLSTYLSCKYIVDVNF